MICLLWLCKLAGQLAQAFLAAGLQFFDDALVFEGRGVLGDLVAGGNVTQKTSHDLARACFGQRVGQADLVGLGDGAKLVGDVGGHRLFECRGFVAAGGRNGALGDDKGGDAGAFDVVGEAHHGGFGDVGVTDQGGLDFHGAQVVPGDHDHVVDASGDPEVALGIDAGAVGGAVHALDLGPVGVHKAIAVAIDAAEHGRPGFANDQNAASVVGDFFAFRVDDRSIDAQHGAAATARGGGGGTGQGGQHVTAGFGLPPGVDDGAFAAADFFVVPHPGFGVDRLAHGAQHLQ